MTTSVSPHFVELTDADIAGIVSDRPTKLTIMGRTRLAPRVRTVRLSTGRRLFKCQACKYASKKATSIPPHQKVHTASDFPADELPKTVPAKKTTTTAVKRTAAAKKTATKKATQTRPVTVVASDIVPNGEPIVSSLQAFIDERNANEARLVSRNADLEQALRDVVAGNTTVNATVTNVLQEA